MSKRRSVNQTIVPRVSPQQQAAHAYEVRAHKLFNEGQFARAIIVLTHAAECMPENKELLFKLGQWQDQTKRFNDAIGWYKKVIALDADHVGALASLASALGKLNKVEEAQPYVDRALEINPEDPFSQSVAGVLLQRQGRLEEAVALLRKALHHRVEQPPKRVKPPQKKDFNQPETEALLWETLGVLAKAGIHAFAVYGTLLGLVREGGLLPFDKDLDIGIPYSEMSRARKCMETNGWVEATDEQMHLINPYAFYHPAKGVSVDLMGFVVDAETGGTYTGFWLDNAPYEWCWNVRLPSMELHKDASPDGQPMWSLQNPEAWLESTYGDWRTPDPCFDTVISASNLCNFSLMVQCYAFARIVNHWQEGKLDKARSLARHSLRQLPGDALLEKVVDTLCKEPG